jgi:hypothetical protein
MIRKSTFLAIAAVAALGLATFSASEASARGHGGGGGMHSGGGMHGGHGGGGMRGGHGGGRHVGYRPHRHPHWHVRYHRPIWYPGVRTVGYTVARPVLTTQGPCTCLSKEYTPDGRVLFKDVCTNEAAINPPIVTPQQTGAIEAPGQQASNAVQYQATPANALPQVDTTTGLPK